MKTNTTNKITTKKTIWKTLTTIAAAFLLVAMATVPAFAESEESGGDTLFLLTIAVVFIISITIALGTQSFLNQFDENSGSNFLLGKVTKKEKSKADYYRNIPFDGNLPMSYLALDLMDEWYSRNCILNAYLLLWLLEGRIKVDEQPSLFGLKMVPTITFVPEKLLKNQRTLSESEQQIMYCLREAAGDDDILQERELINYSQADQTHWKLNAAYCQVMREGREYGVTKGDVRKTKTSSWFYVPYLYHLTEQGKKRCLELIGFKKYLKDFTIVDERGPKELGLWKEYMLFAALLDLSEDFYDKIKQYPVEYFEDAHTLWSMQALHGFANATVREGASDKEELQDK